MIRHADVGFICGTSPDRHLVDGGDGGIADGNPAVVRLDARLSAGGRGAGGVAGECGWDVLGAAGYSLVVRSTLDHTVCFPAERDDAEASGDRSTREIS